MNTLQYYEQYGPLSQEQAFLESQLHLSGEDHPDLQLRLAAILAEKREIEESLTRYVSLPSHGASPLQGHRRAGISFLSVHQGADDEKNSGADVRQQGYCLPYPPQDRQRKRTLRLL